MKYRAWLRGQRRVSAAGGIILHPSTAEILANVPTNIEEISLAHQKAAGRALMFGREGLALQPMARTEGLGGHGSCRLEAIAIRSKDATRGLLALLLGARTLLVTKGIATNGAIGR